MKRKFSAICESANIEMYGNASIEDVADLEKFDARDYGVVTRTKDQGDSSMCWAYAIAGACETSILKSGIDESATKDNLFISPNAIAYRYHNRDVDALGNTSGIYTGKNFYSSSGNTSYGEVVLSQWAGPISGEMPANADPNVNLLYRFKNSIHIDNSNATKDFQIKKIKEAVAQYGAVTFSYNNVREKYYYSPQNETGNDSFPHACMVIGWDDMISASKFEPNGATRDGGWLIKNSYSTLPYFYISYDYLPSSTAVYAFEFEKLEEYDFNYFYDNADDFGLNYSVGATSVSNIFKAQKGEQGKIEYVKAVNVGILGKNVTCEVKVYTNLQDLSNPESGDYAGGGNETFEYEGFKTIRLNSPVKIEKGEYYSVIVRVTSSDGTAVIRFSQNSSNGMSFLNKGYGWSKYNFCARVKAYTIIQEDEEPIKDDINLAQVEVQKNNVYSGQQIKPSVKVRYDGNVLCENVDYILTYENNVFASDNAKVIITGIGNFSKTKEVLFSISKAYMPTFIEGDMIVVDDEQKLEDIVLPSGWVWNDNSILIGEDQIIATATYVGSDADNYETTTIEIVVKRKEQEILPDEIKDNDKHDNDIVIIISSVTGGVLIIAGMATFFILRKRKK